LDIYVYKLIQILPYISLVSVMSETTSRLRKTHDKRTMLSSVNFIFCRQYHCFSIISSSIRIEGNMSGKQNTCLS